MSDLVRVALVAEGPTDRIVIESALRAMLVGRSFVIVQLQPEASLAFGELGGGWGGVYRWCKQSAKRGGGRLSMDRLLNFDILIIHVDADVAASAYGEANIVEDENDLELPCEAPCPPPSDTTNALRSVVCSWFGETVEPEGVVLCTPSKSTEAWVVAMLFSADPVLNGELEFECCADPAVRLSQQSKRQRIKKTQRDYQDRSVRLEAEWPRIAAEGGMTEASRFRADVLAAMSNHVA
jgi:hypothetical protein